MKRGSKYLERIITAIGNMSEATWCTIQVVFIVAGVIISFTLGMLIGMITGYVDVPFLCCIIWLICFMFLKYKVEDKLGM